MSAQLFIMTHYKGFKKSKLLNPTVINCSSKLAREYGNTLTECHIAIGGAKDVKFSFEPISQQELDELKLNGIEIQKPLTEEEVKEEIEYEKSRRDGLIASGYGPKGR